MSEAERPRRTEAAVDPMFPGRWSPRAFADEPLSDDALASLFEAARWAPSCNNEQPWLFVAAVTPEEKTRFAEALTAGNRVWAPRAGALIFVLARRQFARDGEPNRWAEFDCGAAWLSLALQARAMGLYAHAMAGFDAEKAREALGFPADEYAAVAAVAVGHRGDPGALPENLRRMERPNDRKPLAEVWRRGAF
ncbi:MAG: nitroreductase family protein [Candidatus Krumholzibacteriota bacterium]|nr:nitroreductase family protein [Candidatus Krumholzibacteriota bacterium]